MGTNGALTKDNPRRSERDSTIAQMRVEGRTYREICEATGVSKSTVHRVLNDSEVKDVLDTATRALVAFVPRVIDNYDKLLNSEDEKTLLKANEAILKNTGIAPSHAQSQFINNIFITQNNSASPELMDILRQVIGATQLNTAPPVDMQFDTQVSHYSAVQEDENGGDIE